MSSASLGMNQHNDLGDNEAGENASAGEHLARCCCLIPGTIRRQSIIGLVSMILLGQRLDSGMISLAQGLISIILLMRERYTKQTITLAKDS